MLGLGRKHWGVVRSSQNGVGAGAFPDRKLVRLCQVWVGVEVPTSSNPPWAFSDVPQAHLNIQSIQSLQSACKVWNSAGSVEELGWSHSGIHATMKEKCVWSELKQILEKKHTVHPKKLYTSTCWLSSEWLSLYPTSNTPPQARQAQIYNTPWTKRVMPKTGGELYVDSECWIIKCCTTKK